MQKGISLIFEWKKGKQCLLIKSGLKLNGLGITKVEIFDKEKLAQVINGFTGE